MLPVICSSCAKRAAESSGLRCTTLWITATVFAEKQCGQRHVQSFQSCARCRDCTWLEGGRDEYRAVLDMHLNVMGRRAGPVSLEDMLVHHMQHHIFTRTAVQCVGCKLFPVLAQLDDTRRTHYTIFTQILASLVSASYGIFGEHFSRSVSKTPTN
uniref:Uncharacterized protein n=1 Tax=Rhipicephalus zambeziensis TaxID=60191 RepID=A0A224YKW9_9ACAR